MNESELLQSLPDLLRNINGADPQRVFDFDRGWWIRPQTAIAFVSLYQEAEVRITVLAATAVPRGDIDGFVNFCNFKQLVYGRMFTVASPEADVCDVLMQDIVRGDSFSMEHVMELRNFLLRTGTMLGTGDRLGAEIVSRFGGRVPEDNGTDCITPFTLQ